MANERPLFPALAGHVQLRWHHVDDQLHLVLFDARTHKSTLFEPSAWNVLQALDGTRTVEGIVRAAGAQGARVSAGDVGELLQALHDEGWLTEHSVVARLEHDRIPSERPVEPLPGYLFACSGRGGCCGMFPSIVFDAHERARAVTHARGVANHHADRLFLPILGAVEQPYAAVTRVNNQCVFVDEQSRCAIHAAGGLHAKPLPCRLFPTSYLDDGVAVRATTALECACVFESAHGATGEALTHAQTRGDIERELRIKSLPESLALNATHTVSRMAVRAWSEQLRDATPSCVPTLLLGLYERCAHLEAETMPAMNEPSVVDETPLHAWLAALEEVVLESAMEAAQWRGTTDFALQSMQWLLAGLAVLRNDRNVWRTARNQDVDERLALRAWAHGYVFVMREGSVAEGVLSLAARVVLARAMEGAECLLPNDHPARRHPIAVVEAMLRGHGFAQRVQARINQTRTQLARHAAR